MTENDEFRQSKYSDREESLNLGIDEINKSNSQMDPDVIRALHRHFYFMQEFSAGKADATDTNYYEREWRIVELVLIPEGENKGIWCLKNKLPPCIGRLQYEGDNAFFSFSPKDVAFLIAPKNHMPDIGNPHGFQIKSSENLVNR